MTSSVDTGAIRVVLVDDHALFRRGLELVLSGESDLEVVGQASDGEEALRVVRSLTPDVVLMDIRMPRMSGIDAARAIRDSVPGTKVIMLTVSEEEDDLFAAVRAGASGYLLKEVSIDEVAGAVRAVTRGHALISPSMAAKLLVEFNALSERAADRQRAGDPKLTDRELQVLRLVGKGMSNREIASELFIAENTVKNHVRNMLEKLGMHSRMEAVIYAMREGLFESD